MRSEPAGAPERQAYLLLALTALFWAGNAVIARAVHELMPPVTLAFWRWLLAWVLVMPFVAGRLKAQRRELIVHWRALTLLGMFGVAGFNTFLYSALQTTTATNGVLINAVIPVLIVVIGRIAFGTRLARWQQAGVALSLVGVAVIVGRGDAAALARLQVDAGDLWLLGGALCWAIYTVFLRLKPVTLDPLVFLAATIGAGVIELAPLAAWEQSARPGGVYSAPLLAALSYFAVFPSLLAYWFWNRGVVAIGPNRSGAFLYLIPVFGTALAIVFLDEALHWFHATGMALIFAGVYLSSGRLAASAKIRKG